MNDFTRLRELAGRLGLVVLVHDFPAHAYEPPNIITIEKDRSRVLMRSNLAHEIAHWLVAPEKRRGVRDYGLGRGPNSAEPSTRLVSLGCAQLEEEEASLLGAAIERHLLGPRKHIWTLLHHEWDLQPDPEDHTMATTYARLTRKGLLRDGRPTCLARP